MKIFFYFFNVLKFLIFLSFTSINAQTAPSCVDGDSTICSQYVAAGYCSSYTSVQIYCPLSCKLCSIPIQQLTTAITTTVAATCNDTNSAACSKYAAAGYCSSYTSVQAYCPLTCKVCSIPFQQLTTITTSTKPTTVAVCIDSDSTLCSQYLILGYCSFSLIQNSCPLTCKICSPSSTFSPSSTQLALNSTLISSNRTTQTTTITLAPNGSMPLNVTVPNNSMPTHQGTTLAPVLGAQQTSTTTKRNSTSFLKPFSIFSILFFLILDSFII